MLKESSKTLIPVTHELVIELKRKGLHELAEKLVQAFREQCQRQWTQENKELIRKELKIRRQIQICSTIGCKRTSAYNKTSCRIHLLQKSANANKKIHLRFSWVVEKIDFEPNKKSIKSEKTRYKNMEGKK